MREVWCRPSRSSKSEQDKYELSLALVNVSKVPEHTPKIATCLRTVVDPFPMEMSHVSDLMDDTLRSISYYTDVDTESFVKVITTFEPSDVKPLASIRYETLRRNDAVKVLKSVMKQSPQLITGSLSRWLANHGFDQNSYGYNDFGVGREQTFQYLASFATESILKDALSIVKANEHYKIDSEVFCCDSHDSFPPRSCQQT